MAEVNPESVPPPDAAAVSPPPASLAMNEQAAALAVPVAAGAEDPAQRQRHRRAAAIAALAAAVLAGFAFFLILHFTEPSSGGNVSAAGSATVRTTVAPMAGTISRGGASASTTPPAGFIPASQRPTMNQIPTARAPLQIYWRFATGDYLHLHPHLNTDALPIPDNGSASFVRVDAENNTADALAVNPQAFLLYSGSASVHPAASGAADLLAPTVLGPHSSAQGWLLFLKPWPDDAPPGGASYLSYQGFSGARVTLSDRGRAAAPVGPSGATPMTGAPGAGMKSGAGQLSSPAPAPPASQSPTNITIPAPQPDVQDLINRKAGDKSRDGERVFVRIPDAG